MNKSIILEGSFNSKPNPNFESAHLGEWEWMLLAMFTNILLADLTDITL